MKLMWNSTSQMKIHSWSDHCWSTQSLTKQLWAITTYHYLLDGTEIRTYPCLSTSSPVLPEEGNAGLHLASAIYPLLDHWLPVQSTLLILVSHLWWMPAGQMFDSVPLCMCMCVCERLIKMSLDLAVTPSVGALIVWQSANNPLMLWERNRKKKKSNRVKNFHKWTSYSKAYRASWHNDCSYTSSSSTLELIPSFSLLCSLMSSCRQRCG